MGCEEVCPSLYSSYNKNSETHNNQQTSGYQATLRVTVATVDEDDQTGEKRPCRFLSFCASDSIGYGLFLCCEKSQYDDNGSATSNFMSHLSASVFPSPLP